MSGRVRTQRNTSGIVTAVQNGKPLSIIRDLVRHSKREDIIKAYQSAVLKTINDSFYEDVRDFLDNYLASN
jgi:hypothetical protein